MRTLPKIKLDDNAEQLAKARIHNVTKKVAIAFILLIQLAIIYKMLL